MASKTPRKVLLKTAKATAPPAPPPEELHEEKSGSAEPVLATVAPAATDPELEAEKDPEPELPAAPESGKTPVVHAAVVIGGKKEPIDVGHPDKAKRLPWTQLAYGGMPTDGIVLGPDDPQYVRGILRGPVVELTENVYRAIKPPTSFSYVFQLLFNKGWKVDAEKVILITDRVAK